MSVLNLCITGITDGWLTALSTFGLLFFTVILALAAISTYLNSQTDFIKERFENRYFEMIKMYRDNVSEMEYVDPDKIPETIIKGRKVFVKINREFLHLFKELNDKFNTEFKSTENFEKDLISMSWLTIFFGLSNEGDDMLETIFKKYNYDSNYNKITEHILKQIIQEPTKYNPKIKKYGGHQIRLGHYFRHFFQSVTYVHSRRFLKPEEKYDFIKMLRAQMSTQEQAILLYNSLSPLGAKWEYSKRNINYSPKNNIPYKSEDLLITNYKLIKNIPKEFCKPISQEDYYKKLDFEFKEKSD